MKIQRLSVLLTTSLCIAAISLPGASFCATQNQHWALASLEIIQSQKLLLNIRSDAKSLNQTLNTNQFHTMLSDILVSEALAPLPKNTQKETPLTRQEAAINIYKVLNPSLIKNNDDMLLWIQSEKIMSGYPNGDFKPTGSVTVAQGVVMMRNVKTYLSELSTVKDNPNNPPADVTLPKSTIASSYVINTANKVDLTLSWDEKPTGGYSITIDQYKIIDKELHVYYKLKSPKPEDMTTQALTYPKTTITLAMTLDEFKKLTLVLHENK